MAFLSQSKDLLPWIKDFFYRAWLPAIVLSLIIFTAIGVANSTYKSRLYLNDLQKLEAESARLEVEWGKLLLEQHTWGAYTRVGQLATEQLQMRTPVPTEIIMVRQ
jgi:cell division protein FtsL